MHNNWYWTQPTNWEMQSIGSEKVEFKLSWRQLTYTMSPKLIRAVQCAKTFQSVAWQTYWSVCMCFKEINVEIINLKIYCTMISKLLVPMSKEKPSSKLLLANAKFAHVLKLTCEKEKKPWFSIVSAALKKNGQYFGYTWQNCHTLSYFVINCHKIEVCLLGWEILVRSLMYRDSYRNFLRRHWLSLWSHDRLHQPMSKVPPTRKLCWWHYCKGQKSSDVSSQQNPLYLAENCHLTMSRDHRPLNLVEDVSSVKFDGSLFARSILVIAEKWLVLAYNISYIKTHWCFFQNVVIKIAKSQQSTTPESLSGNYLPTPEAITVIIEHWEHRRSIICYSRQSVLCRLAMYPPCFQQFAETFGGQTFRFFFFFLSCFFKRNMN